MEYCEFNQLNSISLDRGDSDNSDYEVNDHFIFPLNHKDNETNDDIEEFFSKRNQEKTLSREKTYEKTLTYINSLPKFDEKDKENGTVSNKNEIIEDNKDIKRVKLAIFKIDKVPKKNMKKGRIPYRHNNYIEGIHTRKAEDNIIRKIKRSFIDKVREFINKKYEIFSDNTKTKLIKRISSKEILKFKNKENLAFFDKTLKELFSSDISTKYKTNLYPLNDNKIQIDKLYKEQKATEVINILNMTVREIYQIYSYNIKRKGFEELRNLKYDLDIRKKELKLRNATNINEYLELYEKIAINLEKILKDKKSRKSSKNKK